MLALVVTMIRSYCNEHRRLSRYYRYRRLPLTVFNSENTQPDLHLIKQVEQVTMLGLEGPARRFARIRRMEIR